MNKPATQTVYLIWLLGLWLWLGSISPGWSQPAIKAEIDRQTLEIDEVVRLKVVLVQESTDPNQAVQSEPPQFVDLSDFDVISQSSNQSINLVQNIMRMMATYTYILKPRQIGKLRIPPLTYRYQAKGQIQTLETEAFEVEVKATPPPKRPGNLLGFGLGLVIFFLALLLLGYLWKKKREKPSSSSSESFDEQLALATKAAEHAAIHAPQQPNIPPSVKPRNQTPLAQIYHLRETGSPTPELLQLLQAEFKSYLGEKLQMDCQSQTTAEILTHLKLQTNYPEKWQLRVSECLKKCDQYRFQPFPVSPQEFDQLLDQTEKIIQNRPSD